MELVQRHKVVLQETEEEDEKHAVGELMLKVDKLQVDLVQVLVGERHEGLLNHLQLFGRMIKEGVEGIPLKLHAEVVIGGGQLFSNDFVNQDPVLFLDNDNIDHDIFREANRSPEVPGQCNLLI